MAWVWLFVAGLMEIVWAIGLKYTEGFTKLYPSIITASATVFSFVCFSISLKTLPIGTAYAVWVGIGVIGVALIGIVYYGEPRDALRLVFLGMILVGIVGLKYLSAV